jgi:hypothetical protein
MVEKENLIGQHPLDISIIYLHKKEELASCAQVLSFVGKEAFFSP